MVEESWRADGIEGWGGFVLKEKIKRLKETLKNWNREHFNHLDQKISFLRKEIQILDTKDDADGLSIEEAARRMEHVAQLILHLNNKRSLLAQKANIRWLREGDTNIKTFHKAIKQRQITNGLLGLEINGEWIEEPIRVKSEVKDFFKNLFLKKEVNLVELPPDMFDSKLDDEDGNLLTKNFT